MARAIRTHRPSVYLMRSAYAAAYHASRYPNTRSAEAVAYDRWGNDGFTAAILTRAASVPATVGSSAWAGEFSHTVTGDFIASLAPISAAAKLLEAAPRVSLDGVYQVNFPRRLGAINPTSVPWVGEGAPVPVLQFVLSSAVLGPARKLAAIAVMTRELVESSSGEQVIGTLLRENAAVSLDTTMFSNQAATAAAPAGILNGVAPLTAAPNGDDQAMFTDLSKLAAAISGVTSGLAYVAHPDQANAIRLRRGTTWPPEVPVWPTICVPAGTVIALDPMAFASAFGDQPEVTSSKEALLQMESAPGSDPMAGPTTSVWQQDMISTKILIDAAWAWRVSGAVAWVQNTTW